MQTVRVVCAHDCPDMCSLIAHVDNGKVVRIEGDPDQPFTNGFACGKVNRDTELVHSPDRLQHPLRRTGPKGLGQFKRISWDEAMEETAAAFLKAEADHGSESERQGVPVAQDSQQGCVRCLFRLRNLHVSSLGSGAAGRKIPCGPRLPVPHM